MSLPSVETIRHLLERLRANDTTWFREKYKSGELSWLKDHMPSGGYDLLGKDLEAGNLDRLRGALPSVPGLKELPGVGPLLAGLGGIGGAAAAVTGKLGDAAGSVVGKAGNVAGKAGNVAGKAGSVVGKAGSAAGAAAGNVAGRAGGVADRTTQMARTELIERKKRGGLMWLLPLALIAALLAILGLTKCGKDKKSTTDTTVAVADAGTETTVASETTAAAAVETTAAAAAPETTAAAASESTAAAAVETTAAAAAPETTAAAAAPETSAAAAAPTTDIVDTALAAGSFTKLGAALGAAGLVDTLKGAGPFTVFAPTDAAFDALPAGALDALLKPENKETLAKVLTYHVVAGKVGSADIKAGPVKSVEGTDLTLAVDGTTVKVNDATVTAADVASTNGVIHVIDKVLIPSDVDVAALLAPAAPATTVAAEVTSVGAPESLTVYFDSGKSNIKSSEQPKVDGAIEKLKGAAAGTKVNIIGHADSTGNADANKALSIARAENVLAAIKAGLGDKASNITFTTGAVGDSQAEADKAKSRKVTIEIAP